MLSYIVEIGGLFAFLSFIHFFADWIFQSHDEAMVKHNNAKVRAKHCLIYSVGFLPVFWLLNLSLPVTSILFCILFLSHFIEDTYIPVYLWAKYIRKPHEMNITEDKYFGFYNFASTPLGKILMITVDQIIHLAFIMLISIIIVAVK